MGAQKNHIIETVLLITHNIWEIFWLRNKKILFFSVRTLNKSPDIQIRWLLTFFTFFEIQSVSNSSDPDQAGYFVGPDLCSNCFANAITR